MSVPRHNKRKGFDEHEHHRYGEAPFKKRTVYHYHNQQNKSEQHTGPEESLRNLVFLLGQKSNFSLLENTQNLAEAILLESSKAYIDSIFTAIIECVSQLAWKTRIYSTLVGILYNTNSELVKGKFITLLLSTIDQYHRDENKYSEYTLIFRFLSDLVTVGVIDGVSYLQYVEGILELIERYLKQYPTFSYHHLYTILSSFIWNGKFLLMHNEGLFRNILVRIGNLILEIQSSDNNPPAFITKEFSYDILIELYSLFSNVDNLPTVQAFEQIPLDEIVVSNVSPHSLVHQADFTFAMSPESRDSNMIPNVRHVFRIKELYPSSVDNNHVDQNLASSLGTSGDSLCTPIDSGLVTNNSSDEHKTKMKITIHSDSVESWILSDIIIHTLNFFNENYHKCADFIIRDIQAAFSGVDVPKLALNCILSEMLSFNSAFPTVYYTMLITDILQISDNAGDYLGTLVTYLFISLDTLFYFQLVTLASWLAHHLSQFGFKWNQWLRWEHLSKAMESGFAVSPSVGLQAVFLQLFLSKLIRLSYYEQIQANTPDFCLPYLQRPPEPCFCYSEASTTASPEELALARRLCEAIKSKVSVSELLGIFSDGPKLDTGRRVLIQSILLHGSKSFSHSINAIDRYVDAIGELGTNDDIQRIFLTVLGEFWRLSPPYIQVILDHLLDLKRIKVSILLDWVYGYVLDGNCWESWAWDVLQDKLLQFKGHPAVDEFIEKFLSLDFGSNDLTSPKYSMMLWITHSLTNSRQ